MSLLLQLPAEIRRFIFELVVGGQLLHIKSRENGSISSASCLARDSENEAYSNSMNTTSEERHEPCAHRLMRGQSQYVLQLDLLRVCRQTYEECTMLLWSTNTFSFQDGRSFEQFVRTKLPPMQKARLAKIHIQARGSFESKTLWKRALRSSIIDSLQGLHTLHLCLDRDVCPLENHELSGSPYSRLLVLPVRHATVIYADTETEIVPSPENDGRWTTEQRKTAAESLRRKLLNPTDGEHLSARKEAMAAENVRNILFGLKKHETE